MTISIEHETDIMVSRTRFNVAIPDHTKIIRTHARGCTELYADGNDLAVIRNQFTNIPMVEHDGGTTWYGDTAKFIAKNIRTPG